jgi:mRNA interferase YafQ
MRTIKVTNKYKRDYKREISGKSNRYIKDLDEKLKNILLRLAADSSLLPNHYDHALKGEWSDCRDCHVKPDLVLIYRKTDDNALELIRLGSHSEIGL